MALTQASIDQLKRHLAEGEFANAEDMNTLKQLIDYEVNIRRKQGYNLTSEIAVTNKQFDTAKYINNLIGGLRKIHKGKFQLVTQNITFIKALFDIVTKIEKLLTYKDQTKYGDNAGCDGECRGLCSGCENSCTGSNNCAFVAAGGGGGSTICDNYSTGSCGTYATLYKATIPSGNVYATYYGGQFHIVDGNGKETGLVINAQAGGTRATDGKFNVPGAQLSTIFEKVAKQNDKLNVYGSGSSSGSGSGCPIQTAAQARSGWNPTATVGGCTFNGACGGKNWAH